MLTNGWTAGEAPFILKRERQKERQGTLLSLDTSAIEQTYLDPIELNTFYNSVLGNTDIDNSVDKETRSRAAELFPRQ